MMIPVSSINKNLTLNSLKIIPSPLFWIVELMITSKGFLTLLKRKKHYAKTGGFFSSTATNDLYTYKKIINRVLNDDF